MLDILILRIRESHLYLSPYTFDEYDGATLPVTITVSSVEHSILPLLIFRLHLGTHSWWGLVHPIPSFNRNELYMDRRRRSWNYDCFLVYRRPGSLGRVLRHRDGRSVYQRQLYHL